MSANIQYTLGNPDLVRLVLLFASQKKDDERIFKSITKLQKLVFLAQYEFDEFKKLRTDGIYTQEPFNFTPDKYGMYSVDITLVLRKMIKAGEIEEKRDGSGVSYKIKEELMSKVIEKDELLQNSVLRDLLLKIIEFSRKNLDELLEYIYKNPTYEDLIKKSLIKDRILNS